MTRREHCDLRVGCVVDEPQERFDALRRGRHDRKAVSPILLRKIAVHLCGRAGEDDLARIPMRAVGSGCFGGSRPRQPVDDVPDQRRSDARLDLAAIVDAERTGILRDAKSGNARCLRGDARKGGETRVRDDDARDTELLCFCCRPRRGRGAVSSSAVAGDHRITAELAGAACDLPRKRLLMRGIVGAVQVRKLIVRHDPDARIACL